MLERSNISPESSVAGRKVVIIASCVARNCDLVAALMNRPIPWAPMRKSIAMTIRKNGFPRNGTAKTIPPTTATIPMSMNPMPRYGSSLPRITSSRWTGVAASCSMVPRSHSRAMVSEVRSAERIIMIVAMRPGTIILLLLRSSLYHTREATTIGTGSGCPLRTALAE